MKGNHWSDSLNHIVNENCTTDAKRREDSKKRNKISFGREGVEYPKLQVCTNALVYVQMRHIFENKISGY